VVLHRGGGGGVPVLPVGDKRGAAMIGFLLLLMGGYVLLEVWLSWSWSKAVSGD
jgi:hypothetical protein